MNPKYILFLLFLTLFSHLFSQESSECLQSKLQNNKLHTDPVFKKNFNRWENKMYEVEQINNKKLTTVLYTIPVVVHIVHNNGPENIPDTQVTLAIQHLNEAFSNSGSFNTSTGTDTEIQFCLAVQDTAGNFTTGITRTQSILTDEIAELQDSSLKDLIRWDQLTYLNIWVVNSISSSTLGSGVNGYAFLPPSHGHEEDGIVIEAEFFGSTTNLSKVLIHEMGHYLGLYHTFEGGCTNNNCLTDGDKVCDTPPDGSSSSALCGSIINSCTTDSDDPTSQNPFRSTGLGGIGDQPDYMNNYLDYNYSVCRNSFTPGQKSRMQNAIQYFRSSLLNSIACQNICTTPINASFISSTNNCMVGITVNFTNTTTGASNFAWSCNNILYSNSFNSSYTFTTPGIYIISLSTSNADPFCYGYYTDTISVACTTSSSFTYSNTINPTNIPITFNYTGSGATNYQWTVDGGNTSNLQNLTQTFTNEGGYNVCLIASDSNCADTSCQLIRIGMCNDKRWNQWVFGQNARIDFNSGSPVSLSGSAMFQYEGCASVCDTSGNLLFYSDGRSVWNKNNAVMANGSGMNGSVTTAQAAMIVPLPKSNTLYYLFTLDEDQGTTGLRYHIIDITQNGGLGAVVLKNQQLVNPASEYMTTVRHCNGTDYWIVTHKSNSNQFYTYQLSPSGINTTAVISTSGTIFSGLDKNIGIIKGSPNGNKLAVTHPYAYSNNTRIELFDFNNSTGVVSNAASYTSPTSTRMYGVEFSPDGKKMYASGHPFSTSGNSIIMQFNMSSGVNSTILTTAMQIYQSTDRLAALQLAPDGKIYVGEWTLSFTGVTEMDAITNPNASGVSCNYVSNYFTLSSGLLWFGLPPMLTNIPGQVDVEISGPSAVCNDGKNFAYKINGTGCLDSAIWNLNGNAQIVSIAGDSIVLKFNTFSTPYNVTLSVIDYRECGTVQDTLIINVKPVPTVNLGPDLSICGTTGHIFNAGSGYSSYYWNNGAGTLQTYNATATGNYWVAVSNTYSCYATDTVTVLAKNPAVPLVNLGPDMNLCYGGVTVLTAGTDTSYDYLWQDNSTLLHYTAYTPGTYYVKVSEPYCNYFSADTIHILQTAAPFDLGADTTVCNGLPFPVGPGNNYISYLWQDNSTDSVYTINSSGIYFVEVTQANGCSYFDTLNVVFDNCTSINTGSSFSDLTIFPNPSADKFNLKGIGRFSHAYIYNSIGQLIKLITISSEEYIVDLSEQNCGLYFLKLEGKENTLVLKLIKDLTNQN